MDVGMERVERERWKDGRMEEEEEKRKGCG